MHPPQRSLIVLRHAKSDWSVQVGDFDRPLSKRGRRDAPAAGRWLASLGITVDEALVSPAVRTRQTWELACAAAGLSVAASHPRGLYLGEVDDLADAVRELQDDTTGAVLVGHAPGCPDFVEWATAGQGEEFALRLMREKFPTAGAAWLAVEGRWEDLAAGRARLLHFEVCRG